MRSFGEVRASCADPLSPNTAVLNARGRRGHVERACHTGTDAIARMNGIDSARMAEAVTTMRQRLSPFQKRGVPEVKRLVEVSATRS